MPSTSTAIEIARNVAINIGFEPPDSLKSRQNRASRRLLSLLNRGCKILASKRGAFGQSWPELGRVHVFTTTPGQADYPLPEGYASLINKTVWDRDTYYPLIGPLTPQEFQRIKGGLLESVTLTPRYRLQLSEETQTVRFTLDPIPNGTEEIAFEYLSRFWARASAASPIALDRVTEDVHIPVFPDHLVELDLEWQMRKAQGLSYQTDIAVFEMERDRLFAQSGGTRNIQMGGSVGRALGGVNIPESGFGGVA